MAHSADAGLSARAYSWFVDATRLSKLLIGEVSGVDDPANESPGWAVMKNAQKGSALDGVLDQAAAEAATTFKSRLTKWLGLENGKEDFDMEKSEFEAILTESNATLAKAITEGVAEAFSKATEAAPTVAAPAALAVAPAVTPEATPTITVEDVAKAIETAFEPYNEILEKILDRVEVAENGLTTSARKSIDGQEGGETPAEEKAPTVSDAIVKALRNPGSAVAFGQGS